MIVVDASAIVELLLRTETGRAVGRRLVGEELHAPAHLDAEVVGALRRAVIGTRINREEADEAVAVLNDLPMLRWDLPPLSVAALDHLRSLTVADAYYVVLAIALNTSMVTCDGPLSRAHGHDAAIELIGPTT